VQVAYCFHPEPVGGTEVYVGALSRLLQERGHDVLVAAPGEQDAAYTYEGLPVRRFASRPAALDLRDLYGEGDPVAAAAFGRLLDDQSPDVLHLHAFTPAVSVRLVREAKRRGIPVVFTYHTPTVSCQRGTLLRWGSDVCDGTLRLHTCSRCTLHGLGLDRATSVLVGSLPPTVGGLIGRVGLSGGPWTALRMTELLELRAGAIRSLMAEADHVVAVCGWARDVLRRNGVPEHKITVSRHGLPNPPGVPAGAGTVGDPAPPPLPGEAGPLRLAYLGRLDPTKGPGVLIRALRSLPDAPVELHLYGIAQGPAGEAYARHLRALAAGDARITFLPPVPAEGVVSRLACYHLLAVPSQWLETGPLVVLEAFAAGVPVIGSDLGGIAELVEHEVDGLLVEPASPGAWGRALRRLLSDSGLLVRLRRGVRPPRGMAQVAEDMLAIYRLVPPAPAGAGGTKRPIPLGASGVGPRSSG
jgi:glycosyltransferase involved in cell wall biosynthesis